MRLKIAYWRHNAVKHLGVREFRDVNEAAKWLSKNLNLRCSETRIAKMLSRADELYLRSKKGGFYEVVNLASVAPDA